MKIRRLLTMVGLGGLIVVTANGAAQQRPVRPTLPAPVIPEPTELPAPAMNAPLAVPATSPLTNLNSALEQIRIERALLEKQRRESATIMNTGTGKDIAARAEMRMQIADLLNRLKGRSPAKAHSALAQTKEDSTIPILSPAESPTKTVPVATDRISLAQVQFRGKEYKAALKSLEAVDSGELSGKDRVWVDYLKASCLKHLGKVSEATTLYREVANDKEEPFLSESAAWQLSLLLWKQEMQSQLGAFAR